jgi:dienelactone hydrolase
MKHLAWVCAAVCLAFVPATRAEEHADIKAKANAMIDAIAKGDAAVAINDFDAVMKEKMPAEKFTEAWKSLTKQLGKFEKRTSVRAANSGKYDVVYVTCKFEKLSLDAKVVFTRDKQVTGLFFVPADTLADYTAPAYAKAGSFRETEVKVGNGEWELPGTLTMPVGTGPFPAVVFVHGSGPNDRDETILGNKPLRDLALGLASQGVAVVRYDKRTRVHSAKFAKGFPTLDEEVTDDALSAVQLLRQMKGIDGKRLFVLGHSLGATLAPRIGERDPQITGLILLAGATRPLEDLILEQYTYIYGLNGSLSDEQKAELDTLKKKVERVKDLKPTSDTPSKELPLGVPVAYWIALRECRPLEVAARVKQPMLILQGERDYQVTMADFEGWKQLAAARPATTIKSFSKLNHLFMEGVGKSKPAEYERPNHVAQEVVDDIAAWIKKQK